MLHRAFAYMQGRIDPPSSLHRLDAQGLGRKAADEICLLAYEDGTLAGCLFFRPKADRLYLSKLAVDPDHQRRDIGRTLMAAAEAEAHARGLPMLELQTRIELAENHEFFAATGFARTGETCHPGFDRPTSVTMRKQL